MHAGDNVQFTKNICDIKIKRFTAVVSRRTIGMYAVIFKSVQTSLAPLENNVTVLDVCHARLAHADRCAVSWTAYKDAIRDMDMCQRSVQHDCFLCIEEK